MASLLIKVADKIASSLCKLFNLSLSLGMVPSDWKTANVTAVLKKCDPTLPSNYRPISLLSTVSKVLERCIFNYCYQHIEPQLYRLQHGFLKGRSTVTQLLEVYHCILDSVARGKEVDAIFLDLSLLTRSRTICCCLNWKSLVSLALFFRGFAATLQADSKESL